MSLATETSNLTLAYINTTNNVSQLDMNIRDLSNNYQKVDVVINDLLTKLNISMSEITNYTSQLIDISNNI